MTADRSQAHQRGGRDERSRPDGDVVQPSTGGHAGGKQSESRLSEQTRGSTRAPAQRCRRPPPSVAAQGRSPASPAGLADLRRRGTGPLFAEPGPGAHPEPGSTMASRPMTAPGRASTWSRPSPGLTTIAPICTMSPSIHHPARSTSGSTDAPSPSASNPVTGGSECRSTPRPIRRPTRGEGDDRGRRRYSTPLDSTRRSAHQSRRWTLPPRAGSRPPNTAQQQEHEQVIPAQRVMKTAKATSTIHQSSRTNQSMSGAQPGADVAGDGRPGHPPQARQCGQRKAGGCLDPAGPPRRRRDGTVPPRRRVPGVEELREPSQPRIVVEVADGDARGTARVTRRPAGQKASRRLRRRSRRRGFSPSYRGPRSRCRPTIARYR